MTQWKFLTVVRAIISGSHCLKGLPFTILKGQDTLQWILNAVHSAEQLVIPILCLSDFGIMHRVRLAKQATDGLLELKTEDIIQIPFEDQIAELKSGVIVAHGAPYNHHDCR